MTTTLVDDNIVARVSEHVAGRLGPRRYAMWFDRSARFAYDAEAHRVEVRVPNQFVADWIQRYFHGDLRHAVDAAVDAAATLSVSVAAESFPDHHDHTHSADAPRLAGDAQRPLPATTGADMHHGVRRPHSVRPVRHRLDDFIVGRSNELAFAAAKRLAEGIAGNTGGGAEVGVGVGVGHPLFIHGACGLGKTHLLQGICHELRQHQPTAKILYTTGERFTNEYITAVRQNKLDSFRRSVRRLDLLAVDDIHFIANKQATQQEFLHSFDEIELGGARLVLASDSHPKLIKQFCQALVSRCVRGMVVRIDSPDDQTRRLIIREMARRRGLTMEERMVDLLAGRCDGSVREIEGTLTKLQALSTLVSGAAGRGAVSARMIERLFDGERPTGVQRPVRFDDVMAAVVELTGVSEAQIAGRGRHRQVVLARSLAVYLVRELTSMSYPEIAAAMGRKNHSTIITAAQRMARQLEANQPVTVPGGEGLGGGGGQVTPVELMERIRRQIRKR